MLICVSDQAQSGHYYATGRSKPTMTNPVSIPNLLLLLLLLRLFITIAAFGQLIAFSGAGHWARN